MDQLIGYTVGVALLIASVVLFRWHRGSWRRAQEDLHDDVHREFFRRQFRRRAQISVMLGLVAVGLLAGQRVSPDENPSVFVGLWALISMLVLWIAVLALFDLLALRRHAQILSLQLLEEQGRLHGEIRRLQQQHQADGNGEQHEAEE